MRETADRAGLAVGAAYYYFRTKQSLVLAFYAETQQAAEDHHREALDADWDFKVCLCDLVWYRLELLQPYRAFITVLARHLDPHHVISPFGAATRELRQRSIALFAEVMQTIGLKPARSLAPHLPLLLWLYQMGITFFWIHDDSPEQARTRRLLAVSAELLHTGLQLVKCPLFRRLNRRIQQVMEIVEEMTR